MRTISLYLVSLFLAIASACWAEHGELPPAYPDGKRPTITQGELPKIIREVMASVFALSNEYVDKRYRDLIPAALKDVFERDSEEDIAESLAQLFATLDEKQVDDLIKTVKEVRAGLPDTAEHKAADEFLRRLLWGGKIVRADATAESKALDAAKPTFEKAFRYHLGRSLKASASFYAAIEKAKEGDEDAKRFLLDESNYDPDVMSRFLGGKIKSGNRELSTNLAEALAERNEAGEHFVELQSRADEKPARVHIGDTPEQFFESLTQFNRDELPQGAKPGGFNAFRMAPRRHTEDEIARGQVFRPLASKPTGKPKAFAKKVVKPGPTPLPVAPPVESGPSKADLDKAVAAFLKGGKCVGCHKAKSDFPLFNDDGTYLESSPTSRTRLLQVLNGQNLEKDGTMEEKIPALTISDENKKLLGLWGKAQGVADTENPYLAK